MSKLRYRFIGRKNKYYSTDDDDTFSMKLNFNCPKEYKDGEGQGSCKGYKPRSEKSVDKSTKSTGKNTNGSKSVVDKVTNKSKFFSSLIMI